MDNKAHITLTKHTQTIRNDNLTIKQFTRIGCVKEQVEENNKQNTHPRAHTHAHTHTTDAIEHISIYIYIYMQCTFDNHTMRQVTRINYVNNRRIQREKKG